MLTSSSISERVPRAAADTGALHQNWGIFSAKPGSTKESVLANGLALQTIVRAGALVQRAALFNSAFNLTCDIPKDEPYRSLNHIKIAIAGEFGTLISDLAGRKNSRADFQNLSIAVCQIVAVTDYFVDAVFKENGERFRLIDSVLAALDTGHCRPQPFAQLDRIVTRAAVLHRANSELPQPQVLTDAFARLARHAKRQLSETPDLSVTADVGGGSLNLFTAGVKAYGTPVPERITDAVGHLGAFCQILDDVHDYPKDLALGTPTALTAAADPRAFAKAMKIEARRQFQSGLDLLTGYERVRYKALGALVSLRYGDRVSSLLQSDAA